VLCGGITNEVIRAAKTFNWQIDKSFVDANSNICEVNDKGFNYNNLTENELKKCQHKTKTIFVAKNFNDAVVISNLISTVGTTVLLSPAAPSYDEFKNFEERGDRFEEIVNKLK
jgi:UDP-N-acetylmuramoylalanine-D-glutamate ligase